jgi:hypothetical protein
MTAVEKGAGEYVIFNVANVREFVLGIDASAKMTWRMDSFDPDTWLAEWVRGRFSKRQEEIANAYRIYFNAWQIHDEQQVPFLMDGQMFSAGNAALGEITKKLKKKKAGGGVSAEGNPQTKNKPKQAAAAGGDAFWSGLNDMHPRSLGRSENIKRAAAQKAGLALALQQARTAATELPEQEAALLRDNLIYQSAIMVQTSAWLEQVESAHESLDLGNMTACVEALTNAEAAFAQVPVLAEGYCRGPWENWYRGCKKLNIAATLKRTREVLEQARQAQLTPSNRENKP